jgi:hypothetical protein
VQNGIITSGVEIVQVSPFGIWIDVEGKEYFLDSERYPWFLNASIKTIYHVEQDASGNLHWPELDVDIELESLEKPEGYPLIYQ